MKKPKILHIGMNIGQTYIQDAFKEYSSDFTEINCFTSKNANEEIVNLSNTFRPDLVFMHVQTPDIIHEETVKHLHQMGAFVVNWTGDVRHPIPQWYCDLGRHIDFTLFTNMTDVEELQRMGINSEYLEIGIDKSVFNPNGNVIGVKPIVFFANNYSSMTFPQSDFRIKAVNYLKTKLPDDFGIYGNGWENPDGNFNHSQTDEAAAYRSAKIAINISHFNYKRYSSDRLLRILAMGTPICLAQWYEGIATDWTDGVHLRTWKTLDELHKLCQYYMNPKNETERLNIVKQGMQKCHKHYTFHSTVENLIKLYNAHK